MRHHRAPAIVLAGVAALVTGCADLPPPTGPLTRFRTQDAAAFLQPIASPEARPRGSPRIVLATSATGPSPTVAALLAPLTQRASTPIAPDTSVVSAGASTTTIATQPTAGARDDAPPASIEVVQTVEGWRRAWEAGDAASYLRHYDTAFHGDAVSRADWERQRRQRLANGQIRVQLERVQLLRVVGDEAVVGFVQHYTSGKHRDTGSKQLVLQRRGADWRIVQERWSAGGA